MREEEKQNAYHVENQGVQDPNLLQIRLETERLVNRFRVYLTGKIIEEHYDHQKGETIVKELQIAEPESKSPRHSLSYELF